MHTSEQTSEQTSNTISDTSPVLPTSNLNTNSLETDNNNQNITFQNTTDNTDTANNDQNPPPEKRKMTADIAASSNQVRRSERLRVKALVTNSKIESPIVLNLFSGPYDRKDGLSSALEHRGYKVINVDNNPHGGDIEHDLLKDQFYKDLLRDAQNLKFCAVYAAPPCSTFSISRFKDLDGPEPERHGPPIVRTRTHILGIPNVPPDHTRELENANKLIMRMTTIIRAVADNGGSFLIENPCDRGCPENSLTYDPKFADHGPLWLMPEIKLLETRYKSRYITFAACMLGAAYQKYTTLMISPDLYDSLSFLSNLICNHKKGEHQERGCWSPMPEFLQEWHLDDPS